MAWAPACQETLPAFRAGVLAGRLSTHCTSTTTGLSDEPAHGAVSRSAARSLTIQLLSASELPNVWQSLFVLRARYRSRHAGSGHTIGAGNAGSESRDTNSESLIRPMARCAMTLTRGSACSSPSFSAASVESRRSSASSILPTSTESADVSCRVCAASGDAAAPSASAAHSARLKRLPWFRRPA